MLFITNSPNEGMSQYAANNGIPLIAINRQEVNSGEFLTSLLQSYQIDFIALAGYLKKIPDELIRAFPRRIVNIHPALLPKFGGKGMYGMNVHEAVIAAAEPESGMTIHLVNEVYDEGEILFQDKVAVQPGWTATDLQKAVLTLEHKHYPAVLERLIAESEQ